MVKQATPKRTPRPPTRPAPVQRFAVTVHGRQYDALVDLFDGDAPVYVSSASQAAFWRLWRTPAGAFVCGCPAHDFRRTCRHAEAALVADGLAADRAREGGWQRATDMDAAAYERWSDSLDATGPDDDAEFDRLSDAWADGMAAARGPYYE